MKNQPEPISEQRIDHMIRTLHMVRILVILVLAAVAPMLFFFKIIESDMVIWVSIGFAFMAVSDWFIIDRMIKRIEKTRERLR